MTGAGAVLPPILTISQAARACGIPERRLRGWVEAGAVPFTVRQLRPRGRRYLPRSQVEAWARLFLGREPDYTGILDELL